MAQTQASETQGYAGRIAVLPIVSEGPHGSTSISTIFNSVSSEVSQRIGIRAITYEEMFVASKDGIGQSVLECGPEPKCIASKLRAFNAKLGLVVVLNFEINPPVISIQLLDTDKSELIAENLGELPASDESSLIKALKSRTGAVLEKGGYIIGGRVIVEADPANALINLPGHEPDKGTPNVFTLPPGEYEFSASREGYSSAFSKATVKSGELAQLKLTLSKESSWYTSPWLWIGVGVVAAGATTAAIVGASGSSRCICIIFAERGCEICNE